MTEKFYDIFYDPAELRVDRHGDLMNTDALRIVEFEYDEETDTTVSMRRVNEQGEVIETEPDLRDLYQVWFGDDTTIREALTHFEWWLEDHLEWRESSPETRWQPAEYICIGIEGYID